MIGRVLAIAVCVAVGAVCGRDSKEPAFFDARCDSTACSVNGDGIATCWCESWTSYVACADVMASIGSSEGGCP